MLNSRYCSWCVCVFVMFDMVVLLCRFSTTYGCYFLVIYSLYFLLFLAFVIVTILNVVDFINNNAGNNTQSHLALPCSAVIGYSVLKH